MALTRAVGRSRAPTRPTTPERDPPPAGGCATHKFKLHVAATGARIRVTVKLDGRIIRKTGRHHLTVTIRAGRAKPGRHRVTATATDRFGRRASQSRSFIRCGTG